MKTLGIITELNPIHNGHAHLMQTAKEQTGADFVVLIMSGDYVQRGIPAIIDKYERTRMALQNGADLVLELPVYYSLASAEFFARGAVSILDRLGIIDTLAFGSESGNLSLLTEIAVLLNEEPAAFQNILSDQMKKGFSFPAARQTAILSALSMSDDKNLTVFSDTVNQDQAANRRKDLISPNNILGIEYLCALQEAHSSIQPFTIKRIGAGYHDLINTSPVSGDTTIANSLQISGSSSVPSASASGIRRLLLEQKSETSALGTNHEIHTPEQLQHILYASMPPDCADQLLAWPRKVPAGYLTADHFSDLLRYKLILEKESGFARYADIHNDLSDKIIRNLPDFHSFDTFAALLKSKDLTYTRIQRSLMHIILNITQENLCEYAGGAFDSITGYARILGFRKDAAPLLHKIRQNTDLPLISKLADAKKNLDPLSLRLLNEDIRSSEIYDMVCGRIGASEYRKELVIIS